MVPGERESSVHPEVYFGGRISRLIINISEQSPKMSRAGNRLTCVAVTPPPHTHSTEGETEAWRGTWPKQGHRWSRAWNPRPPGWSSAARSRVGAQAGSTPAGGEGRGSARLGPPPPIERAHTNVYSENKGSDLHRTQTSSLSVRETLHLLRNGSSGFLPLQSRGRSWEGADPP